MTPARPLHSRRGAGTRRAPTGSRTRRAAAAERLADARRGPPRPRRSGATAGSASSTSTATGRCRPSRWVEPGDEPAPGGGPVAAEAGERVGAGRRAQRPGRAPRARSRRSRPRACGSAASPPATPTRSRRLLGACSDASPDAFTVLHDAFLAGGAFVKVPRGVVVEQPIVVLHWSEGDGLASFPHTLVVAEDGAEVTVFDRYGSTDTGVDTHRSPRRRGRRAGRRRQRARPLPLGAGARPAHVAGRAAARPPRPRRVAAVVGGRAGRRLRAPAQRVAARGSGRRERPHAVYFGDGDQMLDFRTLQDHDAPNTRSDLLFKGAVEDTAQSVYSGLIRIRRRRPEVGGVPDQPQPRAHRGRGGEVGPQPRDRGRRREVLARQHRRPDRRRPALLPRDPRRAARGSRAAHRARASSTTCSTACRCRRWSRRCGAA